MKTLLAYSRSMFWTVGVITIVLGLIAMATAARLAFTRPGAAVFSMGFALLPTGVGAATCLAARALKKQGRFAKTLVTFASLYNLILFPFGTVAGAAALYWCFSPKTRSLEPLSSDFDFQSRDGDGTNKWMQVAVSVASIVIWLGAISATNWWGQTHGLPGNAAVNGLLLIFVCEWISVFFHELGHATAGSLVDMKLVAFSVGPLAAQRKAGRWTLSFTMASLIGRAGSAGTVPLHLRNLSRRMSVEIAAGPAASLVTAVVAMIVLSMAPGSSWVMWWKVPAVVAAISAGAVVINLIPFGSAAGYSDGALLAQLFRGGPMADMRVAAKMVGTTTVTTTRPRDLDAMAFSRAVAASAGDPGAVTLRVIELICAVDRGDLEFARACLDSLLEHYPTAQSVNDPSGAVEIAFYLAYLDGHAGRAGNWLRDVELAEAKKKRSFTREFDYWRTVAAVRMAEGRTAEGDDAFRRAKDLAERFPDVGLYAYERDLLDKVDERGWLLLALADHQPNQNQNPTPTIGVNWWTSPRSVAPAAGANSLLGAGEM